jgi:3-deoxy-manno-octulosonate cytidylyltransferase (CMP-KDO synthetase)
MGRTAIVIPARLASTRFPRKPLALLTGPDGHSRPALSYTWSAALAAAQKLGPGTECIVATDDKAIESFAHSSGMNVVMTPETCRNGTERCAAALGAIAGDVDLIVNFQGDAPLTPADMVAAVVQRLEGEPGLCMATPAISLSADLLSHFQADAAAGRVGGTTVVLNAKHQALYFSKSIIPHIPRGSTPTKSILLHLGVYAYRPTALRAYAALEPGAYEVQEGLEQLRFLEADMPVGVVVCDPPCWNMIELNNPTDAPLIEAELAKRAIYEGGHASKA